MTINVGSPLWGWWSCRGEHRATTGEVSAGPAKAHTTLGRTARDVVLAGLARGKAWEMKPSCHCMGRKPRSKGFSQEHPAHRAGRGLLSTGSENSQHPYTWASGSIALPSIPQKIFPCCIHITLWQAGNTLTASWKWKTPLSDWQELHNPALLGGNEPGSSC